MNTCEICPAKIVCEAHGKCGDRRSKIHPEPTYYEETFFQSGAPLSSIPVGTHQAIVDVANVAGVLRFRIRIDKKD